MGTLDFLSMMAKMEKALNQSEIKVVESSGSQDGFMAKILFNGSHYALFITEVEHMMEGVNKFMVEKTDQN